MIQLNPLVRALIGGVVAAATAALTVLSDDSLSATDAIVILLAFLGTFGIVPPQVGGTQEGVVNPSVNKEA